MARRAAPTSCKVLDRVGLTALIFEQTSFEVVGPGGSRPLGVGPPTSSCFSVLEQVWRDM